MNKICKLKQRLTLFFKDWNDFGFYIAITNLCWVFIVRLSPSLGEKIMQKKHKVVLAFLRSQLKEIITEFQHIKERHSQPTEPTIWFCWLQGENNMPEVPRQCLRMIRKYNTNVRIVVLDLSNYTQYIHLPPFIEEKYRKGFICHAHFADILRTRLLYEQGGVWLDSTLYSLSALPNDIWNYDFYSIKRAKEGYYITECKWSNFFLGGRKNAVVYDFVSKAFSAYLSKNDRFADYFIMDYLIYLGYQVCDEIKKEIDNVPYNNPQVHQLNQLLEKPWPKEKLLSLHPETYLYKLSFRRHYALKVKGQRTLWSYLTE